MTLPLFLRKLIAPDEVKQVLAALDKEKRRIDLRTRQACSVRRSASML